MLAQLKLTNFRGFEDHSLPLRDISVIVGRNNAGKSTVVESLRLISVVTERLTGLNFRDPPSWTELPKRSRGVSPSLDGLGIDFRAICHRYSEPPARVQAQFRSGESIQLLVNPDGEAFAVIQDASGSILSHKGQSRRVDFPKVYILPQVAPLEPEEIILSEDYVLRHLSSTLAPRHFRNQLRILTSEYRDFRGLAEKTWPGLQVRTLEGARGFPGETLSLLVRDRDFVGEIGLMGHGLQMWLQTIWFLARTPEGVSVVLDEPDVYMHPDLQRKMVRIVRDRFSQVIIATHSVEIMAEVHPSEVLVIDRDRATSDFADSPPALQDLIDRLGGIHNIHLARLWTARRCLFVEGGDLSLLKLLHDHTFPDADMPLDDIPNTPIGGWGGWGYAVGSSLFLKNAVGKKVSVYCILDPDYHTAEQVNERYDDASQKNVNLHIWARKEIENYVIVPTAIRRVIEERSGGAGPSVKEIIEELDNIAGELRDDTQDALATEYLAQYGSSQLKKANRDARAAVERAFGTHKGRMSIVSGKELLGRLSAWSQSRFGTSFGVMTVARAMTQEEVPSEVKVVLRCIDRKSSIKKEIRERFAF